MFGTAKHEREFARIETSNQRVGDRVDQLQRDTNGMGTRLDQRIDLIAGMMTALQEQNTHEHERVMQRLDAMADTIGERVEIVEAQVKDLTVKIGVEVGRLRSTSEIVESRQRFWEQFFAGDFLVRYRIVVIVLGMIVLLLLGGPAVSEVEKLVGGLL